MSERRFVPAEDLRRFARAAFIVVGLPEGDATEVAALMVEADLVGADAHGIFRLPQYIRRLKAGGFNPTPNIVVHDTGLATALVDGDNGMGHLVMARAADAAIERARTCGIGWVGVRNSNHAGAASLYAAKPLAHGMIGIYSAVASANHMAPWGGTELLLGTNPLAIAIPTGDTPPVILDIATTVVSYGTVKNFVLQGRDMPEGWMIDRGTGLPLTDAKRTLEGVLLPIGGYKGAGLAMVLGILAGTLNGAAIGRDVVDFNADDTSKSNTGQFIIALDVARFTNPTIFAANVIHHLDELRASARLPGVESIRLPGDERAKRRARRVAEGVPIIPELQAVLAKLADQLTISPL
jgi:LDH2 family malate/lactate/ureidoglycolate dehydrogenase